MKNIIKRGEAKTSKQWIICVTWISLLVASELYDCLDRYVIHVDSFIVQTVVTLLLTYFFVYVFFYIKGKK